MSNPLHATEVLQKYDLDDIHRFSDTNCASTRPSGCRGAHSPNSSARKYGGVESQPVSLADMELVLWREMDFGSPAPSCCEMGELRSRARTTSAADQLNFLEIAKVASYVPPYRSPAIPSAAF